VLSRPAHLLSRYTVGLVPGDLLDLILLVLLAAFAVSGYRQGFIVGVLSFAGFIAGSAVGAAFGPRISRVLSHSQTGQAVTAVVVLIVIAVLGMVIGSTIGVAVRSRVTWRPAALVDAAGGAAVGAISFLLIAWFVGSAAAYSSLSAIFPVLSRQVNNSAVLRGVDRLMPPAASGTFSDFRSLLESGPYAQVFGALGAEIPLPVAPPDNAVLASAGLAAARGSIVKVMGIAPGCSERIEGSGFVYAPDHVLTNAHVVAGVTDGPDVFTSQGEFPARVVLYDPQRDVAVLYVPGLTAPSLSFAGAAPTGADAIVAGYPLDGPFTARAARIGATENATGPDIYQTAQVTRQIYAIRALVQPGNSGGPLLTTGGSVYGVVFAAATSVPDTGYALTASEVAGDATSGENATAGVSTQGCD
jgi:S1-C subfamily serine protease